MIVRDWREAPPALLAPMLEGERERWLRHLQWDPAGAWQEIERARTTWGLPGLIAVDAAGSLRGLLFYVIEDDRLDIGGVISDHVEATDSLIDAALGAGCAAGVAFARLMVFDSAVALKSGLVQRGFQVETHYYLSKSLRLSETEAPAAARHPHRAHEALNAGWSRTRGERRAAVAEPPPSMRAWQDGDVAATAALLRRAYDRQAGTLFAPHDEPQEWERYVQNLVTYSACGTLNPRASRVVMDQGAVKAIALVTDIADRVAHLVQLAVDPSMRGRRIATALLDETCAWLADSGHRALTLLVKQHNAGARALYDAGGFRHDAAFVSATRRVT